MKSQIFIDKKTKKVISLSFSSGRRHDFDLFKRSNVKINQKNLVYADSGYQGIKKYHDNTLHPKKNYKNSPLSKQDKLNNKSICSIRMTCEHVIGAIKVFKIISDKYRNSIRRFSIRFTLMSSFYNLCLH